MDGETVGDLDYDCFSPPTISSDTNEAGQYVSVNEGIVEVNEDRPYAWRFGCP